MVQGLKKIHLDEINSIQERYKYSNNLEQMSNSIKNTYGSIRLIEEQLNARYKGIFISVCYCLYTFAYLYMHTYMYVCMCAVFCLFYMYNYVLTVYPTCVCI